MQRILSEKGVETVIACGLQSEHCVSNTSFSALDLGLSVYVAGDAHSTWSTDDDTAVSIIERQNRALSDRGAEIRTTSDLTVNLHLKLTQDLHLILTHLVRSSITHFVGFLPVISSL